MKKNIFTYFVVYAFLVFMLIIPFIIPKNQILETARPVENDADKTKIELVCDDVVVGIISSYPGEKISFPSEVENNLSASNISVEGWYSNEELTDKFTFDIQPSSDTILYAKVDEQINDKADFTFYLFWGLSILSAIGLGVLFFILNRYYTKKVKAESPPKINK